MPSEWAGWRFDAVLAKLFPEHSRSRLQGWLKDGLIRLDGAAVEPKRKVYGGEIIEFAANFAVASAPSAGDTAPGFAGGITFAAIREIQSDRIHSARFLSSFGSVVSMTLCLSLVPS